MGMSILEVNSVGSDLRMLFIDYMINTYTEPYLDKKKILQQ